MQERSAVEQRFVDAKINDALSVAGLPVTSPLRALLDRDAQVTDSGREAFVCIPREHRAMTLAERLDELHADPMYRGHWAAPKAIIKASDARSLTENFDDIAAGRVTVER
jgi:hypothetical protein